MALQRYTTTVDGTIPIQALLYTDEQLLASQEGVGIYNGLQKSPQHQAGTIHTTSHRLFYIDNKDPEYASFAVDLAYVTQTEYYAGLFTSSPKVTLYLLGKGINQPTTSSSSFPDISSSYSSGGTWECEVCAHKNRDPLGRSPSSTQVCELCGVPRSSSSQSHPSSTSQLSTSLPSNSLRHIDRLTSSASSPAPSSRRLSAIPCPACTFLNHPSLPQCEICGTSLSSTTLSQSTPDRTKSAPTTRPTSPGFDDDDDDNSGEGDDRKIMKISFRKGGVQGFYTILKRSLKSKAWESRTTQLYKSNSGTPSEGDGNATIRGGITGILRSVETSAQGRDSDLTNALQDLEALMIKARDMVHLAAELNEKLTSATTTTTSASTTPSSSSPTLALTPSQETPEEAIFIRSSLSQLGLQMTNVPVTNDMIKDEHKWITELAKELAGVLKVMMKDRGIVALDEVWGGWNRARGVALLPPSTFLQVLPHLPSYTFSPPIHKRTFTKSGLTVLHTPPYSARAFSERLLAQHLSPQLGEGEGKTTMEVAALEEGVTVALVKEMLDEAEMRGDVVRDDGECRMSESGGGVGGWNGVGEAGVRWWPNVFVGYIWDGHTFDE